MTSLLIKSSQNKQRTVIWFCGLRELNQQTFIVKCV